MQQRRTRTHHAVDLRLASLRQVDDVVPVVVQVLHAAVEVPPQEGAGLAGQRDAPETQLRPSGDRRDREFSALNSTFLSRRQQRCGLFHLFGSLDQKEDRFLSFVGLMMDVFIPTTNRSGNCS